MDGRVGVSDSALYLVIDMSLTQDEYAVLMIAEKGESIAAIGRWEKPIQSLVARGLMRANDKFNNVITDAGRVAVEKEDDSVIGEVLEVNNKIAKQKMLRSTVRPATQAFLEYGQDLDVAKFRNALIAVDDEIMFLRDKLK